MCGPQDTKNAAAREGSLQAIAALCNEVGVCCEAYFIPLLPKILERLADKASNVRSAAEAAGKALVDLLGPLAAQLALPVLFESMHQSRPWQVKVGTMRLLNQLCKSRPAQVSGALPEIVPLVSDAMCDPRVQVRAAAP